MVKGILLRGAVCLILLTALEMPALAGWVVADLSPAGSNSWSYASGVYGGQQAGYAWFGSSPHAGMWSGTASSWVDLNPAGATESMSYGIYAGQQVGYAIVPAGCDAGLWNGTARSWVDLSPTGSCESEAYGIYASQQVGDAYFPSPTGRLSHAGMWTGTAKSWVDLNPAGATQSCALGNYAYQQVGWADIGDNQHAGLWTGSSRSWVDLNPYWWVHSSAATAVYAGQQVGYADIGNYYHAGLWSGTASSWVDLNPTGACESEALDVCAGLQAGWADADAGLWTGTASSWVNLGSFLPAGAYTFSYANAVYTSGGNTYVVGYARSSSTGLDDAVLWENIVPEPSSLLALLCGVGGALGLARRWRRD